MPNTQKQDKSGSKTQGGTHEQHVKAGEQSHKNSSSKVEDDKDSASSSGKTNAGKSSKISSSKDKSN